MRCTIKNTTVDDIRTAEQKGIPRYTANDFWDSVESMHYRYLLLHKKRVVNFALPQNVRCLPLFSVYK